MVRHQFMPQRAVHYHSSRAFENRVCPAATGCEPGASVQPGHFEETCPMKASRSSMKDQTQTWCGSPNLVCTPDLVQISVQHKTHGARNPGTGTQPGAPRPLAHTPSHRRHTSNAHGTCGAATSAHASETPQALHTHNRHLNHNHQHPSASLPTETQILLRLSKRCCSDPEHLSCTPQTWCASSNLVCTPNLVRISVRQKTHRARNP